MNDTEICNLALAEIGDTYNITDIDEASSQAGICKRFYASTRDAMLRAHPWNFARKPANLSALATAPIFGWDYQYQLPADFLRLIEFNGLDAWQIEDSYQMGVGPSGGRVLLTDENSASIVYIQQITDANLLDAQFVEAFALKLAARICTKLSKDESIQDRLMARLKASLGEAKRTDSNETRPRRLGQWEDSDLCRSRQS